MRLIGERLRHLEEDSMSSRLMTVVLAGAVAGACADASRMPTAPETMTAPLEVSAAAHAGAAVPHNYRTHLTGAEEVPVRETRAQGQAIFQVSRDGSEVSYRLIASNISNITQAHIHCGPAGVNGPVVIWLYPNPTSTAALPGGGGRHDGVLAAGTFNASHVRPTTNPNCPGGVATFADVLERIRTGNAYVNVHTDDGVAPTNTGPGDFPGGEVRGQIR
jgi:uncharacterized protein (DUF849 family)